MPEQIINLTFHRGGIRNPLPGIGKAEMRVIAQAVRPEPSFGGVVPVRINDEFIYRQEAITTGGLLAQAGAIKEWLPVHSFTK